MKQHIFLNKIFILNFIITLLTTNNGFAQQSSAPAYQISFRYHYGFILVHTKSLQQFQQAHFPMYEITLTKLTDGSKDWQREYHNPDLGMSFYTTDFGKNDLLGRGYALYPNITFHYLRKKYLQANFKFGAGVGYIEKPFNRLTNYKNNAIGSHINSTISIMLETKYKLSSRSNLGIGLALNHFSNGTARTPNLGINLATANIALAYKFADKPITTYDSGVAFKKHWEYFAIVCGGFKEISPAGGDKYSVVTASFNVAKIHSPRGKWGFGFDLMRDASIKEKYIRNHKSTNELRIAQAGLNISWEVIFGKVSFPLQAGVYLYSSYVSNGLIYNRYGIRYHFSNKLFANFSLKTHFAKADYFEWGLGYEF